MIVEQPEAFKSWLTAVLKPMCDADPAALAKYVIALIKKDKADDELRKSMVGQLEVFLEEETEPFVSLVFQTLQSQEYITTPVIPNANPPNPNLVKKDKDSVKDKVIVQPSELPNLNEQINGSVGPKKDAETKRDREVRESKKVDIDIKDKDDKPARIARSRRDRSASRERLRSRSRSWDRAKRSRSREKSRDRERSPPGPPFQRGVPPGGAVEREKRDRPPRVWRNKSPPPRSSRYDRRRSRTPSSPSGRLGGSRSPRSPRYQHRGVRYRQRSLDRSRSRSRSRSLEKPRRDSARDKDREHSRPGTPTQDSNHGDPDSRLTTAAQSVQSAVGASKRRCRDFDEKGYCMRGEMCPFDHGVDPVVLEDAALSRVLNYNPNGTAADVPTNLAPPILTAPGHPMMGPRGVIPSEYNPQAPFLRGFRGPRPLGPTRLPAMGMFPPQPNMARELIPVPVMDNKQNPYTPGYPPQPNFIPMENHDPFYHQNKKNKFDFNRLGPRASKNPANCSLELKKIPAGLNSITHLNNHFSKFGKITNIQVNYEGDTEAAIVTFSSHAEASAAYRSTEAVLNNRFIKVFWHNTNNNDDAIKSKQVVTPLCKIKNYHADTEKLDESIIKELKDESKVSNSGKYMEGIGLKLLLKMGFEPGKGLGKEHQGMSTPIKAVIKNDKRGLGAPPPKNKVEKSSCFPPEICHQPALMQINLTKCTALPIREKKLKTIRNVGSNSKKLKKKKKKAKTVYVETNSTYKFIRNPDKVSAEGKQENVPPRPIKERLGMNQVIAPNTNKVFNLVQPRAEEPVLVPPGSEDLEIKNDVLKTAAQNKEETKAQATAAIKKNQELLAAKEKLKKNQDEQRKEVLKIKQDLRKRKQELLDKQLSQQKILIEKMEKLPPGPQRDLLKETIKKTQESIEEIRKDIANSTQPIKAAVPQKKTKEDAQKEMLDIELDLIAKQQEGADITEIQKKYYELKAKTTLLRTRGRGRARFNPIQRHLLSKNNLIDNSVVKTSTKIDRTNASNNNAPSFPKPQTHSVDHRPTRILVSGYEIEEQNSVLAHFQQFGEIGEYVIDSALPSVTFNFKLRKDAENALLKGKNFQDRTLSITWCSNAQLNSQLSNSRTTRKVLMSESEEEQLIDQSLLDGEDDPNTAGQDLPEEVLLQDDDEDDDEDRSWRR